MIRQIIKIDETLCNGCEMCVDACHEGAIQMKDGKAVLVRDDYCDGLGNCLPVCPTGAITFEQREALDFDEKAVEEKMNKLSSSRHSHAEKSHIETPCGCPSAITKTINHTKSPTPDTVNRVTPEASNLMQWPVQIQLVPSHAGYLNNSHLLIAADCTAYAHPSFNATFMKNKITIIGCPKLDDSAYKEKFTEIFVNNNIKSVTVVRMEVPCCSGIVYSAVEALRDSGKMIPWNVITLATDGSIIED
jgi:NAD-dependent dihydropyrimidine dehydrogenase PreA subunit